MFPINDPAIPRGSTVLVTGANGFIGSNVVDKFLAYDYNVRGTSRNPEKHGWMLKLFERKYGSERFQLVSVPEMEAEGAYGDAIKGVSAVVHTATNYTMSPNPHEVVPSTLSGVQNALRAAAAEPSVKRFILTSSSASALIPRLNEEVTVTADTWNDGAVAEAYREPPYEPERAYSVYAASKMLAERAAWKFVRDNKPGFVLNTVLPNLNFGRSLDPAAQGHASTSGWVVDLFNGNPAPLAALPAQYFVDVQDTAVLHVAAAIHPGVANERIFAFAEPCNGDSILAAVRKVTNGRRLPENFQSAKDLSIIVPRARAEAVLRDMGKQGWTSLEESIRTNIEDLV